MVLVKATTPSGKIGFFCFDPPAGTVNQAPGEVVFQVRDSRECGPNIRAKAAGPNKAEVTFTSDDLLMSFSDYVVRAGGKLIPFHQDTAYRAALKEWSE